MGTDRTTVRVSLTSNAVFTTYKNVDQAICYYDVDLNLINVETMQTNALIMPGESEHFELKTNDPKATKSALFRLINAEVVN